MARNTLTKVRRSNNTATTYDPDSSFYATHQWRKFRATHKAEQFQKDIQTATKLHNSNKTISGLEFAEFISQGQPLCQDALKENEIRTADVLDHIHPIRQGGSVWDKNNLQWLSNEAHNRKRAKEGHQSRATR